MPTWTPTPGSDEPFDWKARQWFERRLCAELPTRITWSDAAVAEQRMPYLVAWFVARATDYVQWVDAEDYRGDGYGNGAWQIQWGRVVALLTKNPSEPWCVAGEALQRVAEREVLARDAAKFATLDAWLEAERRGQLTHRGAMEPDAKSLLPEKVKWEFLSSHWKRQNRWPRLCATCRESFRPERRGAKRCPACVAGAKSAKPTKASKPPRKCVACGEQFTPTHHKNTRCATCRSGAKPVTPSTPVPASTPAPRASIPADVVHVPKATVTALQEAAASLRAATQSGNPAGSLANAIESLKQARDLLADLAGDIPGDPRNKGRS